MSHFACAVGCFLICSFFSVSSAAPPEFRVNFSQGIVTDLIPDSEHTILSTHSEVSCQDASNLLAGSEHRPDFAKEIFVGLLSEVKQRILGEFPEIDGGLNIS